MFSPLTPVRYAPSPATTDLAQVVARLAASPARLLAATRYDAHNRWYTRLPAEPDGALDPPPDHEAWLLSWLPGQRTGIHDHGGSAGAFAVVAGTLTETTATQRPGAVGLPNLRTRTFQAGESRAFGPAHVHEIVNLGAQPAVSVHAYGPALSHLRRYILDAEAGLVEISFERAGVDW